VTPGVVVDRLVPTELLAGLTLTVNDNVNVAC